MVLKKVVLPAPLGPIRLTIAPRGMAKSTLLTATNPPKRMVMAWASSSKLPPARDAAGVSGARSGRGCSVALNSLTSLPLHHVVEVLALGCADVLCFRVQFRAAARARQQPLRAEEHEQHQYH